MAFWNMFLYIKSKPPIHFRYPVSEVCCYICVQAYVSAYFAYLFQFFFVYQFYFPSVDDNKLFCGKV